MSGNAMMSKLKALVHEHRVRYEVAPEICFRSTERLKVGFEVRVWAGLEKGSRMLPRGEKSFTLAVVLREIAEWLASSNDREMLIVVEQCEGLYASSIVPGADEVAITIRLIHRDRYARPIDSCGEKCLKEIRTQLKELGAHER